MCRRLACLPVQTIPIIRWFEPAVVRLAVQLPLLIVLDDLHWASDSTLQLLHHLTRQLTGQSVFMVGTYRVENIEPDHPLATLSRRLERNRMSQHVRLEPLTQPDD